MNLPGGGTWGAPPVDGKRWEEWFADEFNKYRALDAGSREVAVATNTVETVEQYRQEVIRLVNEIRQKEGLTQLETFEGLDSAARMRGDELLTNFGHVRPNGQQASSAYEGLPFAYGGENIVCCSATLYGAEAADGIVSILMGSEGHKRIILNPDLRYIGVGAAFDDEHTLYCVQGFMK